MEGIFCVEIKWPIQHICHDIEKKSHQAGVGDGQAGDIDGREKENITGTTASAQNTQTAGAGHEMYGHTQTIRPHDVNLRSGGDTLAWDRENYLYPVPDKFFSLRCCGSCRVEAIKLYISDDKVLDKRASH